MLAADNGTEMSSARRSGFRSHEFCRRFVVLACAALISIPVIYTSRPVKDEQHPRAAFPVLTSARGYICIEGTVRFPGIYSLPANNMTIDAIKMAGISDADLRMIADTYSRTPLASGDVVNVLKTKGESLVLRKRNMTVHERLILGIPLNINTMSRDDFDKIPGIGPVLAQRIVEYRHKNGDSMKVTDLLSVEGIGENNYNRLKKYF